MSIKDFRNLWKENLSRDSVNRTQPIKQYSKSQNNSSKTEQTRPAKKTENITFSPPEHPENSVEDYANTLWGGTLNDDPSSVIVGIMPSHDGGKKVTFSGEGHLVTVAPTGSGKGMSHIIPNLLYYPGSVVVLDIKNGENYARTGEYRRNFGPVFRFDPFGLETDCYNPLMFLAQDDRWEARKGEKKWSETTAWADCKALTELLVIPEKDYFDDRARAWLTGILYWVVTDNKELGDDERTMETVCEYVYGDELMKGLWIIMDKSGDERLRETAEMMRNTADKEYSAVMGTMQRSLEGWRSPEIQKTTSDHNPDWIPADLRRGPALHEVQSGYVGPEQGDKFFIRGASRSIYIIMPDHQVESHISVLRVLLGQHINEVKHLPNRERQFYGMGEFLEDKPSAPVMILADEFPLLGNMKLIPELLTLGRSYGLRLWLFAQDVGQIAESYKNWRGILSNCVVQSYMNINDNDTARVVSERLPQKKPLFGDPGPLASVADLMGPEFDQKFVCLMRNKKPMKLDKLYATTVDWMRKVAGLKVYSG